MEVKSILKTNKRVNLLRQAEDGNTTQSSSIGAVRWTLPAETLQAHSSAPSRPTNTKGSNKTTQQHQHQSSINDLRSLQECVQFINHWKEQVDQVCKFAEVRDFLGNEGKQRQKQSRTNPLEATCKRTSQSSDRHAERSLEESRKLILKWADELHHVDKLLKDNPWASESQEDKVPKEEAQMRIMEWAKELQKATEGCGVEREELGKVLRQLSLRKKRLVNLLPLLEFITWSLLKEDSAMKIPQLWLLAKQRTWKAGIPRYIPNPVWSWICSAEADVILDPMTNHPWLQLSDDQRMVQEGHEEFDLPESPQRFDTWTCVLGWQGYSRGRHYWEVDIAKNGYWRVGVTTSDSQRQGRFPMTPKQGYWVLWRSTHQFFACTKPETPLPISLVPRRMGIYLDYDEGQISFYNAETKSHIFTFTGTFRKKLYPLFAPLDGRTVLRITPPHTASVN